MLKTRQFCPQLEALGERVVPANAHFITATDALGSAGQLTASFKEAGLGDATVTHVVLSADGTAQYQAFNNGGNKPQGQPFQVGPITLTAGGDFTSGKNGTISGSLTVQPPPPPQSYIDAVAGKKWTTH